MTFSLDAVAEPSNVPPRVLLTATESDPDLSIQTVAFFRDGAPLRFEAAVTGDSAVAYDYDAPFDVALTYRADGTELGTLADWTEDWVSLADWTGSGWAVAGSVASSTVPGGIIYRDTTTGHFIEVSVDLPTNVKVEFTDASDDVAASVLVSVDGTVTLTGTTVSKVAGSGSFTVSFSENSVAVVGTGWSTSVAYSGDATRLRLVAPAAATFLSKFGTGPSTFGGGMYYPIGVAVAASGDIWVANLTGNQVKRYNSSGVYQNTLVATLSSPSAIAIDASGNIYVADSGNNRVQKFDSTGTHLLTFGSAGSSNGQFNFPMGIAFDSGGNVWVVDSGNYRVQKFNSSGVYQSKFGAGPGSADGNFSLLGGGIAIDASDNVWVTDAGANDRVQKFNSSGVFQSKFGTPGTTDGKFNDPAGIAIDAAGNVWVADKSSHRLQKFDSAGAFIGKIGSVGSGDGQFSYPDGLTIDDATGDLLVADVFNQRVQRFDTSGGSVDDIATRIALDEPVDVTASDTATLSPSGATAGAWLTNAATPDLAILAEAEPASSDDEFFIVTSTRESGQLVANSVALPIEGSSDVLTVVLGPRLKETWTLDIACTTQAAYQTLTALLANSSVISLRFPVTDRWVGLDGGFYAVGDVDATRVGHPQLGPVIIASLPLLPARAPKFKPLWQWNWNTLVQTGMSWDDVAANFDSWNDVLVGPN